MSPSAWTNQSSVEEREFDGTPSDAADWVIEGARKTFC